MVVDSTLNSTESPLKGTSTSKSSKVGLLLGGVFGLAGVVLVTLTTPFILPALRKHCLPYVPCTDSQLSNLSSAFKKHVRNGETFLDIGSGDGRICRLAAKENLFTRVHGVELNSMLVFFARLMAIKSNNSRYVKYYHCDLWKFPLHRYDTICIFGVESMMTSLEQYLKKHNTKPQTIIACRFPFQGLALVDEIGEGIDTVWVYRLAKVN